MDNHIRPKSVYYRHDILEYMEQESTTPLPTDARLILMEQKIDYLVSEAHKSARARKITFWVTILVVVLPFIGILALLPSVMGTLTGANSLGV